MSYHLLFVSATPLLSPPPAYACPSRDRRYHAAPQAIAPQSSPPAKLITATNLSQTARVVMSLFQLSTFVTPILVNPLYASHILTTLPQNYPVIQALGLTNLSTFLAFHAQRRRTRSTRIANTIIFAATAAVYLIIPVKPQHVNIPFTFTLGLIALANAFSLPKDQISYKSQQSFPALALVRLLAGFAIIVSAFLNPLPLQRVYLLQIGLNLAAAAALASDSDFSNRVLFASDITLLLATAACLSQNATMFPAVMFAVTVLFETIRLIKGPDNLPI